MATKRLHSEILTDVVSGCCDVSLLISVESVLLNHHLWWEPGRFMVGLAWCCICYPLCLGKNREITVSQWRKQAKWRLCLSCTILMPCVKFCISASRGLQGAAAVIGTIIGLTSEAETMSSLVGFCISTQSPDNIHFASRKALTLFPWRCVHELMKIPLSILWIICIGEIRRIFLMRF